jgi:hypothetical protein
LKGKGGQQSLLQLYEAKSNLKKITPPNSGLLMQLCPRAKNYMLQQEKCSK